ncbi:MAG: hypothetical protein R3Y11_11855 [Pseudomonadota bacterium]
MRIAIEHKSPECNGYRSACVRSLFNVDESTFKIQADLPLSKRLGKLASL